MLWPHFCHGLRKLRCAHASVLTGGDGGSQAGEAEGSGVGAGWYKSAVVKRTQLTIPLAFGFSGSSQVRGFAFGRRSSG